MSEGGAWVRLLLSTLQKEGCSKSAALVLAVIADKATEHQSRSAWLKQSEIAASAGVDRRTVRRAVQQLRALGLIETQQQQPGERLRYTLTDAVELSLKSTVATRAAAQRKRAAAAAKQEQRDKRLQEYAEAAGIHTYYPDPELEAKEEALALSLVNRFKEDEL